MAGNSQRKGAVRRTNKKGASVGSGGKRKRGLAGRGPTPRAEDRPHHKAYRSGGSAAAAGGKGRRGSAAGGANRGGGGRSRKKNSGGPEIVAGRNPALEVLRAGIVAERVYLAERLEADDRIDEIISLAADNSIPLATATRRELDVLSDGGVHQGVAVLVPPYEYAEVAQLFQVSGTKLPLVMALDGITDPHNLGAIIRSTAAFGGTGLVLPARRSATMNATAWKSSAGAAARVPVAQVTNLTATMKDFQAAGFFVLGLDMGGDIALPGLPLADQPLLVVVGSEGKGLSRLVRETCDQIVSVPMSSAVESLNASVAASVVLYEVARLRAAAGDIADDSHGTSV